MMPRAYDNKKSFATSLKGLEYADVLVKTTAIIIKKIGARNI